MRSNLQEHVQLHSPNPGLRCPTCKRDFTSRSKLRVHRLREAGEKVHRCHLCDYSAVERNAIRRHIISIHADADVAEGGNHHTYPCPSCGLRFHQSRSLKAHMKTHNSPRGGDSLTCVLESCSFQISSHKELLKHILDVHGVEAVECRYHACGAVFRTEAEMLIHYTTHRAYHCPQCDFSCSNKALFLRHQRGGHAGAHKLCCDFCSFFTFNPVESEQHVRQVHPNEKIYRCSQCSYATAHRRSLKRHSSMHSGEKPHKCGVCDFRCRDESYLSRHMLTHSDDKNFMCSDCGYVTKWKHYLTVHMRRHAGDMRYQCDQCTYRCHRVDQLKSHKLRHQAKSLICEICAFACKRKCELRSHMTSKHSDGADGQPSLYQCKFCTYTTRYRQALRNHENCQHTRLKEFHCALCSYVSFSSISLFLHKRKAHGYVPGDQRWLDRYAAKEKERSSTQEPAEFYRKSSNGEHLKHTADGERGPQGEQAEPPAAAELSKPAETKNVKSVGVLDEEPQEGGNESITGSSHEYCTLIFTTLPMNAALQNEGEHILDQSGREPQSDWLKEKEGGAESTCLSEGEEEETSVNEECDLHDLEDPSECVSQETPELVSRSLSPNTRPEVTCVRNRPMSSQKKMRTNDSDQTEALVLDGQVEVPVVPDTDVGETALNSHGQAVSRRKKKERWCQVKSQSLPKLGPRFLEKCPSEGEKCVSDETESSSERQMTAESNAQELHQLEITSSSSSSSSSSAAEPQKTDGMFRCGLCTFTSLRPTTFQRHVTVCQRRVSHRDRQVLSGGDDGWEEESVGGAEENMTTAQEGVEVSSDRSSATKEPGEVNGSTSAGTSNPGKIPAVQSQPVQKHCTVPHDALKHRDVTLHRPQYCTLATERRRRVTQQGPVPTGRHRCVTCSRTFGSSAKLHQHRVKVHDRQPALCCPLCDFRGHTQDDLGRHNLQSHTGGEEPTCSELRDQSERVPQPAARLPGRTSNSGDTLEAGRRSPRPQLKCTTCEETFVSEEALELHRGSHRAHPCHLCPFAAETRQLLAEHLGNQHEGGRPEDRTLACGRCSFTCRHPLVLEHHLRSHGGRRLYKCRDCQYSTGNKQKMTRHRRTHTGEKPHGCRLCAYTCADPSRLQRHLRVHQDEKKFLCPDCGYRCKWSSQLKYHMTRHTGEKLFPCGECEYRTNRADALRTHRDTRHCDLRPYVCEKCGKAFKTRFILNTHQRQHSDGRLYACGLCPKAFRWPAGLRHHYLSHMNQQPFSCARCSYRARQKFQVVKHLRRHHPDVSVEEGVVKHTEAKSLTLKEALQGHLGERGQGANRAGAHGVAVTSELAEENQR